MQLSVRSAPTLQLSKYRPQVDRKANLIRGVVAMQSGVEATGHHMMADKTTLDILSELGNAKSKGVRGRLGHPGMSENATGKQLQVARNFTVRSSIARPGEHDLVHDSHLLESARKSPSMTHDAVEWLMTVAEKHPTELGESVVISTTAIWILNDGTEVETYWDWFEEKYINRNWKGDTDKDGRPLAATTTWPVMRPVEFFYVDFVNEGALTHDGLFHVGNNEIVNEFFRGRSSEFAQAAFAMADEMRKRYKLPLPEFQRKMGQLITKYVHLRNKSEGNIMDNDQDVETGAAVEDELEAAIQSLSEDSTPVQYATAEQVEALSQAINALTGRIDQLSRAVILMSQKFAVAERNVNRLSGETVGTEIVPMTRPVTIESLADGEPAIATRKPAPTAGDVKGAKSSLAAAQVAQNEVLMRQRQRQARLGVN